MIGRGSRHHILSEKKTEYNITHLKILQILAHSLFTLCTFIRFSFCTTHINEIRKFYSRKLVNFPTCLSPIKVTDFTSFGYGIFFVLHWHTTRGTNTQIVWIVFQTKATFPLYHSDPDLDSGIISKQEYQSFNYCFRDPRTTKLFFSKINFYHPASSYIRHSKLRNS